MTTPIPDEEALRDAPPALLEGVDVCRALSENIELRAADGDDDDEENTSPGVMVGHFSRFDDWYEINSWIEGRFLERVARGAFKRTFNNRSGQSPVRVLLEHGFDPTVGDKPLGRHLELREDDVGAYAEVDLFDTSYNRDLVPALRGGAYGQSFRFQVMRDEWVDPGSEGFDDSVPAKWRDLPQRTLTEVRIAEHGPTVFPASPTTNADVRSTSDQFYERLRRRDPAVADAAIERSRSLRLPNTPAASATGTQPEDSPVQHSEDPPARRHSEDSPARHSEAATTPTASERSTVMEPMTIEERTARQSEIRARLTEIDSEYPGSELPEEARSEFDELSEEFEEHQRSIDDARERQERIRAIAADDSDGRSTERVRPATAPATHTNRGADIYDLSALRQQARSIDDMPRLYRDNAMRAIESARFPGAPDRARAQERVEQLLDTVDDEQGTLARRVLTTGSPTYLRAFGKHLANGGLTAEEQRAMSLGTDSEGGFAVPFQLDPTVILTSDGVADPLRQMARVEQITGKEWQGITSAGVSIGRSGEESESADDSFTLQQPSVSTTRVDAFVPFSLELEADWARLQSEITRVLADAKRTEEAGSFINGDGTGNNPEGLLAGTNNDVLPATAATYSDEDLYNLEESLPERWLENAAFLAHRSFYNATRQLSAEGDGGNLWVRLQDGLPPELIGYPARRHSELPAFNTGAADGTVQAVFGDFRQFLIVDRIGMSVELVPHLVGANRRPTGQRGIYAYWRNACKVLVDGAFRRLVTDDGV